MCFLGFLAVFITGGCLIPIYVLNQRRRNDNVYVSQCDPDLFLYLSISTWVRNLIIT